MRRARVLSFACVAGALYCSDTTGTTVEVCDGTGHDEDCDGEIDEGFDRNDNPLCSAGTFYLGSISGDTGSHTVTDSYHNEEWDRVTITEDDDGIAYLSATIELYSPPGIDYDLYVYCFSCSGGLAGTSTVHGLSGHYDAVEVRANDDFGADDSHDIIIEVRHYQSNRCAYWDLEVEGNTSVVNQTCNP